MKKTLNCSCVLALTLAPSAVLAGPETALSVVFQDFPQGTICAMEGSKGDVTVREQRGHPKLDIIGYPEVGEISCLLPTGEVLVSDVNKRIGDGVISLYATVFPDGTGSGRSNTTRGLVFLEMSDLIIAQ